MAQRRGSAGDAIIDIDGPIFPFQEAVAPQWRATDAYTFPMRPIPDL